MTAERGASGKRAELLALAERVEALQGPSRDVDAEIALAVGYANCRPPSGDNVGRFPHENPYGAGFFGPAYTIRLDAAMSLCPQPPSFDLSHDHEIQGGKWQCLVGEDEGWTPKGIASGFSPALALTAASLRARAAMEERHAE